VVVARIETVDAHPNADRLRVCQVDIGAAERLRIVCGAPNAVAGMKVPCATVGGELPGGLRITAATVRGVVSQGMLCSSDELGIDADAAGLLALPDDAPVGADVRDVLQLDDALITLKITPNRADCLSVLGIAREVAAVTGAPLAAATRRPVAGDEPRRARRAHRGCRCLPPLRFARHRGDRCRKRRRPRG
jgi:phenylalanyl-tRNA synthetase beta chain